MRRRLLTIVTVGIVLIFMTWLVSNPPAQRRTTPTNGPLVLSVGGPIRSTNELTSIQLDGLTRRFTTGFAPTFSGLTNALMIQISNRGPQTIEFLGYDSASPLYYIYVDETNGLGRLKNTVGEHLPTTICLGPTQSVSFPVISPATDRRWHVEVSYKDYIVPIGFMPKAPTPFENLIDRIRAVVPFLRKPEPQSYYTMSESIAPTETGTGHSVEEKKRTP